MLTGTTPRIDHIVRFGSRCDVLQEYKSGGTWKTRSKKGRIVGFGDGITKGYTVFMEESQKTIITKNVRNVETLSGDQNALLERLLEGNDFANVQQEQQDERHVTEAEQSSAGAEGAEGAGAEAEGNQVDVEDANQSRKFRPRKGKKKHQRKQHEREKRGNQENSVVCAILAAESDSDYEELEGEAVKGEFQSKVFAIAGIEDLKEPRTFREAMKGKFKPKWIEAVDVELDALMRNGTFELVIPTEEMVVLKTKWVFKVKTTDKNEIERFKARICVQGQYQREGIDYTFTFAAVMEVDCVRVVIVFAVRWRVAVKHGDVPNAFAKASLREHICVEIPDGFDVSKYFPDHPLLGNPSARLKLLKSLYGLKQAGREWSNMLKEKILALGFKPCFSVDCLYYKEVDGKFVLVATYVDDVFVVAQDERDAEAVFEGLKDLEIKNLGNASKALGMVLSREEGGSYSVSQQGNIESLVTELGLHHAKPLSLPIATNYQSHADNETPLGTSKSGGATLREYQSLVGSLLWIMRCSRPDIAFAVQVLTQQMKGPRVCDWELARKVVQYLHGTKELKLWFKRRDDESEETSIVCFSDADYASDKESRRSICGCLLLIDGCPVTWYSKKQNRIATSTAEAEYVAASEAIKAMLGVRNVLEELGIKVKTPMDLKMDSNAAICQLDREASSKRNKHLDLRIKYVGENVSEGAIKVDYVSTEEMTADLMTKALGSVKLRKFRAASGVR